MGPTQGPTRCRGAGLSPGSVQAHSLFPDHCALLPLPGMFWWQAELLITLTYTEQCGGLGHPQAPSPTWHSQGAELYQGTLLSEQGMGEE